MFEVSKTHLIPTVTPRQLCGRICPSVDAAKTVVVDLRTPREFDEDCVPGAQNIPLFRNEERALIGTLYKRESPEQAFAKGREVVAGRIGDLFREIASAVRWDVPDVDLVSSVLKMTEHGIGNLEANLTESPIRELPERAAIFHCWRGGLRSKSVVALLRLCGFQHAFCVEKGYQGYRRQVLDDLEDYRAPKTYVLRGFTGTGKTLVLRAVEALRPGWTVDLEGLAGHRSSILGMVGLKPVGQKAFESALAARLRETLPHGPLVLEGESRKIGDRIQPASIWQSLQSGINIKLMATKQRRIEVLIADYLADGTSLPELREKLPFIEKRLGPVAWKGRLVNMLDAGNTEELTRVLLDTYYDPLYTHSEKNKRYALEVQMDDPSAAAEEIVEWIEWQ